MGKTVSFPSRNNAISCFYAERTVFYSFKLRTSQKRFAFVHKHFFVIELHTHSILHLELKENSNGESEYYTTKSPENGFNGRVRIKAVQRQFCYC